MRRATGTALIGTLILSTYAQSSGDASVVSVYIPGVDNLPYVASLVAENNGAQTMVVSCGPGVDADTCGFPSSVTVTAGPSTAYVSVATTDATFIYDCKITADAAAICGETFQGNAAYLATDTASDVPTGSTSLVTTETLAATDITKVAVTITAGAGKVSSASSIASSAAASASSSVLASVSSASPEAPVQSNSSADWQSQAVPPINPPPTAGTPPVGTDTVQSTAMVGTPGAGTGTATSSVTMAAYTGAADKLGGIGNYAAGILALAGMAL